MKIYDRKQIMEMHEKGYSLQTIATVMGTNPLTIGCIIRKEEREHENRIHLLRLAEAKKSN